MSSRKRSTPSLKRPRASTTKSKTTKKTPAPPEAKKRRTSTSVKVTSSARKKKEDEAKKTRQKSKTTSTSTSNSLPKKKVEKKNNGRVRKVNVMMRQSGKESVRLTIPEDVSLFNVLLLFSRDKELVALIRRPSSWLLHKQIKYSTRKQLETPISSLVSSDPSPYPNLSLTLISNNVPVGEDPADIEHELNESEEEEEEEEGEEEQEEEQESDVEIIVASDSESDNESVIVRKRSSKRPRVISTASRSAATPSSPQPKLARRSVRSKAKVDPSPAVSPSPAKTASGRRLSVASSSRQRTVSSKRARAPPIKRAADSTRVSKKRRTSSPSSPPPTHFVTVSSAPSPPSTSPSTTTRRKERRKSSGRQPPSPTPSHPLASLQQPPATVNPFDIPSEVMGYSASPSASAAPSAAQTLSQGRSRKTPSRTPPPLAYPHSTSPSRPSVPPATPLPLPSQRFMYNSPASVRAPSTPSYSYSSTPSRRPNVSVSVPSARKSQRGRSSSLTKPLPAQSTSFSPLFRIAIMLLLLITVGLFIVSFSPSSSSPSLSPPSPTSVPPMASSPPPPTPLFLNLREKIRQKLAYAKGANVCDGSPDHFTMSQLLSWIGSEYGHLPAYAAYPQELPKAVADLVEEEEIFSADGGRSYFSPVVMYPFWCRIKLTLSEFLWTLMYTYPFHLLGTLTVVLLFVYLLRRRERGKQFDQNVKSLHSYLKARRRESPTDSLATLYEIKANIFGVDCDDTDPRWLDIKSLLVDPSKRHSLPRQPIEKRSIRNQLHFQWRL